MSALLGVWVNPIKKINMEHTRNIHQHTIAQHSTLLPSNMLYTTSTNLLELLNLGLVKHGKDVRGGSLATLLWMLLTSCTCTTLREINRYNDSRVQRRNTSDKQQPTEHQKFTRSNKTRRHTSYNITITHS